MELISVIVPIYNSEKFLKKCLESIVGQEYSNVEILLIDDGSEDDSRAICEEFTEKDDRFKYFYQRNAGVAAARNNGLANANGEYICFVDSDDWLNTDHIKKLYDIVKESGADLAVCGISVTDGDVAINAVTHECEGIFSRAAVASSYLKDEKMILWNSTFNKLFKKEKIYVPFDESVKCGEDCIFVMRYMESCDKIAITKNTGYNYFKPQNERIKYLENDARQCFLYSQSVGRFLASCMEESNYMKAYERFVCGNVCRDAAILAKTRPYGEAKKMVNEFYDYPTFCKVLNNRAWKGLGKKYIVVGWLMKLQMINLLVLLSKI